MEIPPLKMVCMKAKPTPSSDRKRRFLLYPGFFYLLETKRMTGKVKPKPLQGGLI
jgi:hypothetical protein